MSASQPSQSNGAAITQGERLLIYFLHCSANQRSTEQAQQKFEQGIWHALYNWDPLKVAVQNEWGGPDSEDKRDWLAGAISEIFETSPETDALDIEVVLLQALQDEFDIRLEDETEVGVAQEIMRIKMETGEGNFSTVDALQAKWLETKDKPARTGKVRVEEKNQDWDGESVDEESEDDEDGDVSMDDAPALVPAKAKSAPEVDEDGFTKVVGKRGR
jgi:pre-rRNA-processing protein TSR2